MSIRADRALLALHRLNIDLEKFTELTDEEFFQSYDWSYIMKQWGKPYSMEDVEGQVISREGENDGADWFAILKMKDGKYLSISAGCDYTGWG